jgi:hypothetical protein
MSGRPILITGAHRSGSTWVGKMVGKSREVCYIFEPFNKDFGPGICRRVFNTWFPYVTEENEEKYLNCLKETVRFKFHLFKELRAVRTKWQLRNCFENFINFRMARMKNRRPMFKDPIAIFSAPWLARRFDFQVVALIRHPMAFAGSLKRLNWQFHFKDFLKQPLLLDGPLKAFKSEIETRAAEPGDIIDQAILLWNVIYGCVKDYREQYPGWIYARHEDISMDPVNGFKDLFAKLDLEFTPGIEQYIREYSGGSNPVETPGNKATFLKRDSSENIHNWKKRLTPEEIDRVKQGTEATACLFYPELRWGFVKEASI